jgi:hypothetical protein
MIEGMRAINLNRKNASIPNKMLKIFHESENVGIIDVEKMKVFNEEKNIGPGSYEMKDLFEKNKNNAQNWSK